MNSSKAKQQTTTLDKIAAIALMILIVLAAFYAVYTSNRIYTPIGSTSSSSSHSGASGLPVSPSPQTQPTSTSSVQLQSGSGTQQSSSPPPQNAADYNDYPPTCSSSGYMQPEVMCPELSN